MLLVKKTKNEIKMNFQLENFNFFNFQEFISMFGFLRCMLKRVIIYFNKIRLRREDDEVVKKSDIYLHTKSI